MTNSRYYIKHFSNPSGTLVYRVEGTKPSGKRVRRNFTDPAAAEVHRQQLESEALGLDLPYRLQQTSLSEPQLRQAELICRTHPDVDLQAAVDFYVRHRPAAKICPTVEACVTEFLNDCKARKLRNRTVQDYRTRCSKLLRAFGARPINSLTSQELTALIRRSGGGHYAQNGLRRVFNALMAWAIRQDYLPTNPVAKIGLVKGEAVEPVILDLAGVKRLLVQAAHYENGKLIPMLILTLFCGLRPNEYERLTWSDLDWEHRELRLSARVAKTRSRRVIPLTDEALAWLFPHGNRPLVWSRWRKEFQEVRRRAGFVDDDCSMGKMDKSKSTAVQWASDILRHTAISYYVAKHQNVSAAAAWAGNSVDVIHTHYRSLVSTRDAEEYWSFGPIATGPSSVLELESAA